MVCWTLQDRMPKVEDLTIDESIGEWFIKVEVYA